MPSNLQGEFAIMENLGIKPNYAALGRKYDMDWRTVKNTKKGTKEKQKAGTNPANWNLSEVKSWTN